MTRSVKLIRVGSDAADAALASTWLWAELMDVPEIRVTGHDAEIIIELPDAATSDGPAGRIGRILDHARFSGWALAPAREQSGPGVDPAPVQRGPRILR